MGANSQGGMGGGMGGGGNFMGGLAGLFQPNQSAFPNMSPGAISGSFGGPGSVPTTTSTLPYSLSISGGLALGGSAPPWEQGGFTGDSGAAFPY